MNKTFHGFPGEGNPRNEPFSLRAWASWMPRMVFPTLGRACTTVYPDPGISPGIAQTGAGRWRVANSPAAQAFRGRCSSNPGEGATHASCHEHAGGGTPPGTRVALSLTA